MIIKPKHSFSDIVFGLSVEEVINILGVPDSKDVDEEDITLYYKDYGIDFLIFMKDESDTVYRFVTAELNKFSKALLWGRSIFDMNFNEIRALALKNGYILKKNMSMSHTQELAFDIDELCLSFYFPVNRSFLEDISLSVAFDKENPDCFLWPSASL